ncbi:MAG: hypothetical protein U0625_01715 [Phycisphaerales bacterium]
MNDSTADAFDHGAHATPGDAPAPTHDRARTLALATAAMRTAHARRQTVRRTGVALLLAALAVTAAIPLLRERTSATDSGTPRTRPADATIASATPTAPTTPARPLPAWVEIAPAALSTERVQTLTCATADRPPDFVQEIRSDAELALCLDLFNACEGFARVGDRIEIIECPPTLVSASTR